ncbi:MULTISPECIES: NADP-dependent oxidoreductase [Enterococcus]|jgi:NADPH:quinone reductase-like Zn-dependent oxidoreductase|uniref:Oxidoreductase, zinc-binding n=2 Tax=Enterococcus TaxID=1350 RepID=S0K1L9_9ENTE|nr:MULTISPECIES: NADP-dependent oxidoreductase [Enterococcus]EOT38377.1 oxidoreductase, zinc-binding [Enterococcus dispar ATCC 51266]EOW85936.1 oxidoreductase, zinc-binding [Enterococcus dispar ATCC 51266]MCU7356898.1 NADP-dependent oxidoreductase [Enterococcus dispar]MDT2705000.1 NADP-dependent oxidoreductase [Enterococcus dispar]OJG38538.1 oxidoreductase, zinc-binding [Enterococcus dispar]
METRAIVINQYGGSEGLQEENVKLPALKEDQVLVQVQATSINPIDWKLREGYLQQMFDWEFPIILGWDVAGIISAVGENVTDWQIGDRVFARPATTRFGTYADYAIVDTNLLAKIPANISFEAAAATPLAALTAYQGLFNHGHLQKGEKVLIHAGAGGVGTYAIQLAKAQGAEVFTTASKKNHELLYRLGADKVIDYHEENFAEAFSDLDLVLDTMGGKIQEDSVQVLKNGGRLVTVLGISNPDLMTAKNIFAQAIWLEPNGKELAQLANRMQAGQLESVIGAQFPLTAAGVKSAHELSATHHAVGKIVLINN